VNPNSAKLRNKINAAKKRSKGHRRKTIQKKPISERQLKAIEMGFAFEEALGRYRHRPALSYFKLGEEGFKNRTITFLFKAALLADEAGASYKDWVEAQFYWFHKWFKRPPKVQELSGQSGKHPAPKRYTDYIKLRGRSKASFPTSDILPKEAEWTWGDKDTIDQINQGRLQDLCSAWGRSPEEIIAQFALSGIFDATWLKKNPIFQKLKQEGRLL